MKKFYPRLNLGIDFDQIAAFRLDFYPFGTGQVDVSVEIIFKPGPFGSTSTKIPLFKSTGSQWQPDLESDGFHRDLVEDLKRHFSE